MQARVSFISVLLARPDSTLRPPHSASVVSLKNVLQPELQLAHCSGRGNLAKCRRCPGVATGRVPVRMVGKIECLESELQRVVFADGCILDERKVPLPYTRFAQYPASYGAEPITQLPVRCIEGCNIPELIY